MGLPARLRPLLLLAAGAASAQEATYFQAPEHRPWLPTGALELRDETFRFDDGRRDIRREQALLDLRWALRDPEQSSWNLEAGLRARTASDGNRSSLARLDNEFGNGTRLGLARLSVRGTGARGGWQLEGGLLENPLVVSEAFWDRDLRVRGGAGRAFVHSAEGEVRAELRAVNGRVPLPVGIGDVGLAAGQLLLQWEPGAWSFRGQAALWRTDPDPKDAFLRRLNPASFYQGEAQRWRVFGAQAAWNGAWPLELRGQRQVETGSRAVGEDFQAWTGSPARAWWPQFAYIRQRLAPAGTLASMNGDAWWFHAGADGQRYVAALNLPHRWRLELDRVDQRRRDQAAALHRTGLSLKWRF